MEKCGNLWKNGRFSGRIWPDWGNTARADMAGLGSKGLRADTVLFTTAFLSLLVFFCGKGGGRGLHRLKDIFRTLTARVILRMYTTHYVTHICIHKKETYHSVKWDPDARHQRVENVVNLFPHQEPGRIY